MAITFKVGFQADVKDLESSLGRINKEIQNAFNFQGTLTPELTKATQQAMVLEKAMKRATTDKGISYYSLESELRKAGSSATKLTTDLTLGGSRFRDSLNQANTALALSNRQVVSLNAKIKEMSRVLVQSFKFTAAQTFIREVTSQVQEAVRWVVNLNEAITNIGVVTGKTDQQLESVTRATIEGSQRLKVAAQDYAEASLIFFQQGLDDKEVQRRTELTLKSARAANQSVETMSSQLTSIWNNYRMIGEEQERAAAVGAALAAQTAVDFKDIAEAMETAAAPAAQMGVEYNQLAAIIATVGDVSQQSASVIGNAYKTIFSRFQQLTTEGTDGEVTLNSVSKKLENLGIKVLDQAGNLRDLGTVIEEVGNNWKNWTQTQQTAIAQIVGGTRQYGQFLTLMNNFDKYQKNLQTATSETGETLEAQYTKALDSIEARAEQAGEAWNRAFANLIPEDALKSGYKMLEGIGNLVNTLLKNVGGLPGLLSIVGVYLSTKIVPALANAAATAKLMLTNLTPEGRRANIDKEYDAKDAALVNARDKSGSTTEIRDIEAQRTKLDFDRQLAKVMDDINTKLQTATGEYKIQLQQQKQLLEAAQQLNQSGIDRLNDLAREAELLEQNMMFEQQALNNAEARERAEIARLGQQRTELERQRQEIADEDTQALRDDAYWGDSNATQKRADILARIAEKEREIEQINQEIAEREERINEIQERRITSATSARQALAAVYKDAANFVITSRDQEARTANFQALVTSLKAAVQELGLQSGMSSEQIKAMQDEIDRLNPNDQQNIDRMINEVHSLGTAAQLTTEQLNEMRETYIQAGGDTTRANNRIGNSTNPQPPGDGDGDSNEQGPPSPPPDQNQQNGSKLKNLDFKGVAQGLAQIASSATMAVTAVMSLGRGFETLFKGDIIGGLSSIAMGISMLIPACLNFAAGIKAVNVAIKAAGITVKQFLLVISAVTLAIVALAAAVKWIQSQNPEAKLKKAQEAAQKLGEELNNAKQEAESLQSAFNDYDSIVDQLKSCTKGTQEWRDALADVNNKVLEILTQYPELGAIEGAIQRNKDGMLEITDTGRQYLTQQTNDRVTSLQTSKIMADREVSSQKLSMQKSDVQNALSISTGYLGQIGTKTIKNDNGNDYTTSIDPSIKVLEIIDELGGLTKDEMKKRLEEIFAEDDITFEPESLQALTDAVWECQGEINDYTNAVATNQKIIASQNQALASSVAASKGVNLSATTGDAVGRIYTNKVEAQKEQYSGKSDSEIEDMYKKLTGVDEIADGITRDMMEAALASKDISDNFQGIVSNVENTYESISSGYQGIITSGATGMTKETFDQVQTAYGEGGETGKANVVQLLKDNGFSQEMIDAYLQDIIDSLDLDWSAAISGLPNTLKEVSDQMSYAAIDKMTEAYNRLASQDGVGAADAAMQSFKNIIKDFNVDDQTEAMNILSNIDWSNWDSAEAAVKALKSLGYEVDETSEEWITFTKHMKDAYDAVPDFTQLCNDLKTIRELSQGLEVGDFISDEDLQTLMKYNDELGTYFALTSEGYQMIGDPLDQMQSAHQALLNNLKEQISANETLLQEKNAQAEKVQGIADTANQDVTKSAKIAGGGEDWHWDRSTIDAQFGILSELGALDQLSQDIRDKVDETTGSIKVGEELTQSQLIEIANLTQQSIDQLNTDIGSVSGEIQAAMNSMSIEADVGDRQSMLKAGLNGEEGGINAAAYTIGMENAINTEKWEDLDPKEVEDYADALQRASEKSDTLSKNLLKDAEAAEDVSLYTKKMNKGIDKLADGYEDWSDVLKKSSKESEEYNEAMDNMKDAMSDVLGVSEDFLSDKFILDNMEDIKKAAEGDAEAIDRLAIAASKDIILGIAVQNGLDEAQIADLTSKIDNLATMIPDIKVGAKIDTTGIDGDASNFLKVCQDIVDTSGMTAEEANAAFRAIGFEPEFVTEPQEVTNTYPTMVTETEVRGQTSGTYPVTNDDGTTRTVTWTRPILAQTTYQDGYKEETGTVEAIAMSSDGTPQIKSLKRTNKGSMNNYSKSNSGGGSPGGGSKSKGGGGGKSSSPVKKVQKTEKKDKERYTDNENAIEDVTNAINRLSKANDHAFGPQKIRNLNLMNIQLAKQAKAYQGLYNEAKMYTKLDAMSLVNGLNEFNQKYGTTLQAVFDGDDLLDNQMEIMNIITNLQNAKIDEINTVENKINELAAKNVAGDDPRVTALNEQLGVLKDSLSEIDTDVESMVRKNLDNYQEAIRKAEETMQAMVDILHQGLANEIEKYTLARDLHIKINDLEREHWEAIMDNMGEVGKLGKQTADMLSKSLGSLGNSVDRYVKHYGQMEDVQKRWENRDITLKAEYGITDEVWDRAQESGMIPQEIMDAFEGDIDALMSLRQEVWDNLDRQWQNYIDTIQHYIDEYDRITDKLDRQASISDNLLSLIDTVGFNYKWGADEDSASFKNMNAQMDIVRNKAKVVNGELEVATNRRIEAERELNNLLAGRTAKEFADNASEDEMFEYDRIKAHYDEMADLEADLNEQRISLLNEAYEKATEYAEKWGEVLAHESEKSLNAMFSSYDQAMDMYNQKRDIDTFFMDEEDKVFELNKLQREINKTIEDASDPEMLSRYNELLKEIDEKKQAGVKMTEKDLEILQAQFDLEQARDAYEDARNAKNTMRLARDASGNWSYVYSADNSQTEDQAAAIEEKLHNIRKLNRDAADEYSETWLQLQVDWDNYIKRIDKARFEQEEEYRKEVEQRNNWYAEQSDLLSGEIIKHNDAIDRSFADTTTGVIINFGDMAQANETYKDNHNQLREKLRENYQSWIDKANETKDEVGGSMKDLEEVVNEETGKMMDEVEQLDIQIDTLNADAQSALGQLEGYISEWVDTVNREFQTTIDQIDALIDAYLEMLEVMAQQADANAGDPNYEYNAELNSAGLSYNRLREIKKNSGSYEEFLEKAQNDKDLQYWAWNGVQKGEQMSGQGHAGADYWKDKYGGDVDKALDSMIDHIWNEAADKIDHKSEETDKSQQAINSNNKYRAATGGLFEHHAVTEIAENGPEIVLNKQDTENILKAVSMMREAVGRQMGAKSLALDSQVANASASASDYTPAAQEMQFDQNVKIEAVFPGVSAAGEIEQALNSIITQAAQYRIKK